LQRGAHSGLAGQEEPTAPTVPRTDVIDEVHRLLDAGDGVPFWIMGGAAIQLHCQAGEGHAALSRVPLDIDVVTPFSAQQQLAALLGDLGYTPNRRFNALNSRRRLLFYDEENERQLDVFVDQFAMCHELDLIARLREGDGPGLLPPAELMMTKLQIVKLNHKDLQDIAHMLLNLPVGDGDDRAINGAQMASVYARDWGLWRTATLNLDRIEEKLPELQLEDTGRAVVAQRSQLLAEKIASEPKSRRWRARARLGERVRWYQEPEEVGEEIVVNRASEGAN
jgi:hypothetical protein